MNTQKQIEQLEQAININESLNREFKRQLEELKQQASKPKPMFKRGEKGDYYYNVNEDFKLEESTEVGDLIDDARYHSTNYYLEKDKHIAERVAQHYKDNNWFIRKALEFADGYEWVKGEDNVVLFVHNGAYDFTIDENVYAPGNIYMTLKSARRFKAWLEEYAPLK